VPPPFAVEISIALLVCVAQWTSAATAAATTTTTTTTTTATATATATAAIASVWVVWVIGTLASQKMVADEPLQPLQRVRGARLQGFVAAEKHAETHSIAQHCGLEACNICGGRSRQSTAAVSSPQQT
jgi:hypothetical protein